MGNFVSRLRRRESKVDQLDHVHQELEGYQLKRGKSQSYERSFVAYLVVISFVIYLIGAIVLYLYLRPATTLETLLRLIPFVVFPIIVFLIKWLLSSFFTHQRTKLDLKINELKQRKKKLLEDIKESEPYNVVKQILEKYDPDSVPRLLPQQQRVSSPRQPSDQALRQRHPPQARPSGLPPQPRPSGLPPQPRPSGLPPQPHPSGLPPQSRPSGPPPQPRPSGLPPQPRPSGLPPQASPSGPTPRDLGLQDEAVRSISVGPSSARAPSGAPGPPTPRYIPPRERGVVEKVVDFLLGEGPGKRYALICSACFSHNGMALQDEFEYISFRCAYCHTLNPARKQLPSAPKLESSSRVQTRQEDAVDLEENRDEEENKDEEEDKEKPSHQAGNNKDEENPVVTEKEEEPANHR